MLSFQKPQVYHPPIDEVFEKIIEKNPDHKKLLKMILNKCDIIETASTGPGDSFDQNGEYKRTEQKGNYKTKIVYAHHDVLVQEVLIDEVHCGKHILHTQNVQKEFLLLLNKI